MTERNSQRSRRRGGKRRRVSWDKYTDFSSRHSKDDLAKLCAGYQRQDLEHMFNIPDTTGLCPIHWAAIHNRSDLIEFFVDNGARIRVKCRNKLFADGTALHLAAMNGCIEAAGMLLRKCEQRSKQETKPKRIVSPDKPQQEVEEDHKIKAPSSTLDWLAERDAEGQTPLMRSAAPRSKRLDIVRDLLRKNLWSLSARPSEMALFLINRGADWRLTEPKFSMNLMHLAIVNDYDDIVSMLIVIDSQLLDIPAKMKTDEGYKTAAIKQPPPKASIREQQKSDDFVTVKLSTSSPSSASSTDSTNLQKESSKPLIDERQKANNLLSSGISPLQLAIVYERLNIISLLWSETSHNNRNTNKDVTTNNNNKNQSMKAKPSKEVELRAILMRVVFSNKDELFNLIRGSWLKFLLAFDLALLTLVWMPVYLTAKDGRVVNLSSGIFLASYCLTLALTFRVIAKNPGYLAKNTEEYFQELQSLIRTEGRGNKIENSRVAHDTPSEQQRDLIHLQDSTQSEVVAAASKSTQAPPPPVNQPKSNNTRQTKSDLEERVRLLCHRCRTIRKPRSRHCNYCHYCVQDFDHHCIYLGCCVGRYNRLDFLIMLMAVSLTATYGIVIQASSLNREQWQHFWHFMGLIWIGKYALIGYLTVFSILRRASLGVTMYEEIRSNRVRKIFGSDGAPLNIMKSHKRYSTMKGSFWRYVPNRFLTGDLPSKTLIKNLKEFTNHLSIVDYFMITLFANSSLARSMKHHEHSKVDKVYKYM